MVRERTSAAMGLLQGWEFCSCTLRPKQRDQNDSSHQNDWTLNFLSIRVLEEAR